MRRILACFLHKERKCERSLLYGRGSRVNFWHGSPATVTRSVILNKKRPGLPGRLLTELEFCLERDASDDRALAGQLIRRQVR